MRKNISLLALLGLGFSGGKALGCSCGFYGYTLDTLESGAVVSSWEVSFAEGESAVIDTVEESDVIAALDSLYEFSAIVYAGSIDTSYIGTADPLDGISIIAGELGGATSEPDSSGMWQYALVSVREVFKGELPGLRFWIKAYIGGVHSCYYGYGRYWGVPMVNFSQAVGTLNATPVETCGLPGLHEVVGEDIYLSNLIGVGASIPELFNSLFLKNQYLRGGIAQPGISFSGNSLMVFTPEGAYSLLGQWKSKRFLKSR